MRAITYKTLVAFLTVTGMRLGEALALDRNDVDLVGGIVSIRETKFRKARLVPIHASTRRALQLYCRRRDRIFPSPATDAFFLSAHGRRLLKRQVEATFVRISRQVGLRSASQSYGPRLHDLRHRFAVQTLVRWYRRNADAEKHLPKLSTYLGHNHVTDTYWYITAVPELLQRAAARMEKRAAAR
jgi:integrase